MSDLLLPRGMKGLKNFFLESSSSRKLKFTLFYTTQGIMFQKQSLEVFFSANMQHVYRKSLMWKYNFKKVGMQNTFFEGHFQGTASDVFIRKLFVFLYLLRYCTTEFVTTAVNIVHYLIRPADCRLRNSQWHGSFILFKIFFFAKIVLSKQFKCCTVSPAPRAICELSIRASHFVEQI